MGPCNQLKVNVVHGGSKNVIELAVQPEDTIQNVIEKLAEKDIVVKFIALHGDKLSPDETLDKTLDNLNFQNNVTIHVFTTGGKRRRLVANERLIRVLDQIRRARAQPR